MSPTISAALRRITSEPVPLPSMIGIRLAIMAAAVTIIGLIRSSAPSIMAWRIMEIVRRRVVDT